MYFSEVNDGREIKYAKLLQVLLKAQKIIKHKEEEFNALARWRVFGFNNFLNTESRRKYLD